MTDNVREEWKDLFEKVAFELRLRKGARLRLTQWKSIPSRQKQVYSNKGWKMFDDNLNFGEFSTELKSQNHFQEF